jgi:hypothetical protein
MPSQWQEQWCRHLRMRNSRENQNPNVVAVEHNIAIGLWEDP